MELYWNSAYLKYPEMKSFFNLGRVADHSVDLYKVIDSRNNLNSKFT